MLVSLCFKILFMFRRQLQTLFGVLFFLCLRGRVVHFLFHHIIMLKIYTTNEASSKVLPGKQSSGYAIYYELVRVCVSSVVRNETEFCTIFVVIT